MTQDEYEVFLIEETNKLIEDIIGIVSNIIAKLYEVKSNG